ncbi:MAG: phage Gp37/Gp68 family protein [Mesorhizobium sp.]|nr:MAG: phage Gp37/Gp68 family protein [Mesorhizobium sp.]
MADKSAIEWTDATWTPIRARNRKTGKVGWHCEHATTGCVFCYSEGFNKRLGTGLSFKPGHRQDIDLFLDEDMLTAPLRWKKPRMIFVCSMTDLFADFVPDDWIDKMFAVMALSPQHTFQVLTKRAKRMRGYLAFAQNRIGEMVFVNALRGAGSVDAETWRHAKDRLWPMPNVWLGVSAERQQEADQRIPDLLATPAATRFVSAEPLLGPLDILWAMSRNTLDIGAGFLTRGQFAPGLETLRPLDWVIVGGESGHDARPMHPDWAREIRHDCAAANVPFFFKQWGAWADSSDAPDLVTGSEDFIFASDGTVLGAGGRVGGKMNGIVEHDWRERGGAWMTRINKKAAGRLLDGVEHNAMPEMREVLAL